MGSHSTGIALEHSALAAALLQHAGELPGVTVRRARVTGAIGFDGPSVHVETSDGERLEAAVLIAADGRGSKLREAAGIGAARGAPVRMAGVLVKGPLPYEGYGHVVLGGRAPVLAYRVGRSAVRVLFTRCGADGRPGADDVSALPDPLAAQVAGAVAASELASTTVFALTPGRSSRGRLFLAGDSGGCVHPVTATGVSFCAADALRLQRALGAARGDVLAASEAYAVERTAPLRTRVALGPLLAETLGAPGPEARALRTGLVRYWRSDRRGRGASIGLLSTHEPRFGVLAREYVKVLGHALAGVAAERAPISERLGLCARLVSSTSRLAARALRA
ncbi:MAG: FAD-dependent monooxygenase [Archangiaceae bacterium]|nr:FAD-dependent monooxygenase [Archangiaceae bacterium]